MPSVTILHLSDLHYSTSQSGNISIIRNALTEDLIRLYQRSVTPDIVILSGDLVLTGEDDVSFTNVNDT
jgi:3',5'-cyclic AMP phosphodiesterase CpdA